MTRASDSTFVRHIPCPGCGSRDNRGLYSDGHENCFGCGAYKAGDGQQTITTRSRVPLELIQDGEVQALTSRKINEKTCEHFGYKIAEYKGKPVQVAPYYNASRQLVAQKIRFKDKTFKFLGDSEDALPFGAQCWPNTGKMLVVTEGEIDALSMSQVQGNKWPVVSIGCGAGAQIKKYIAKHREYFNGFEKVILMFDMDDPGRAAAQEAARIIGSRAHIAVLPHGIKDANEALVEGRTEDLITAMWRAEQYKPDGLVDMATLEEAVKTPPAVGLSFPWESLTKLLYGIRLNCIYMLGAGTGVGKTDFYTEIIAHLATVHKKSIGVFYLEQPNPETARRIAGKVASKTFHVPDSGWTADDVSAAWKTLQEGGKVFLYDAFGVADWSSIKDKIEYLHHAEGVEYFVLDHLTALAAGQEDERKSIEDFMSDMGGLVQKLPITIFCVSHLATPEGKPHEEGGRVFIRHFKGSRAIGFWSTDMFALERNQQAEDITERCTTFVRILKERLTGRGVGEGFYLRYDRDTGRLHESGPPDKANLFRDESTEQTTKGPERGPSDF